MNVSQFLIADNQTVCLPFIESNSTVQDNSNVIVDPGTTIVSHSQEGDCLLLDTRFSGGCEEHLLQLVIDVDTMGAINLNNTLSAILAHDNFDQCDAEIALEVGVDISNLKELQMSEVLILIEGYSELVRITF